MAACPFCPSVTLKAHKHGGWFCPECGERVAEPAPTGEEAGTTGTPLEALPFPVAYPLHHARDRSLSAGDRLDNAIFVAYQAMRLSALLLLADYLACEATSRRLAGPIAGLRMPFWGTWSALADRLSEYWNGQFPEERPSRESNFPALVRAWQEVNRRKAPATADGWSSLLEGLPGSSGKAVSANGAVWKLRNDRAHRMATRTADQVDDQRKLAVILPVVERLVATLFPAGSPRLVRCVERAPLRVIALHGAHPDLLFVAESLGSEWSSAFDITGVVALAGDVAVPIYPLFVPGDEEPEACRVGSGGLIERVSMVDGVNEKRLVLLGVRSHGESERHVGPLLEALARKGVDPGLDREGTTRWSLAGWSRVTARESVAQLVGRKYFAECYVERRKVDDVLAACTASGGRGLLVLGEAGAGKSSLLARLVEALAAEREDDVLAATRRGKKAKSMSHFEAYIGEKGAGDVVLYVQGQAFAGAAGKDEQALLCDTITQRAGVRAGAFAKLADFVTRLDESVKEDADHQRRVWVILDALNEAPRFTDLLSALDRFLPSLEKYPWLRLVVSLRSGAYHSLTSRKLDEGTFGGGILGNARFLHAFYDELAKKEVPYLDLPPFNEHEEGPAAYALRQSALPERSSSAPYAQLSPALRRLLLSPLRLHLFHDTFLGTRAVPAAMDEGVLLDAYIEHLCADLPGLRPTLADIGRLMFESRSPLLPLDVADGWLVAWRSRQASAARVAKLDPIEELVAASVLMRPSEDGVGVSRRLVAFSFSHEKLCERVLLRELKRQLEGRELPTGAELLAWAERAAGAAGEGGFTQLVGALEAVAVSVVQAGEEAVLPALLDLENDRVRTRILGAAVRALGPAWGFTEDGKDGAAGVLRGLVELAERPGCGGGRFESSVWAAGSWLKRSGFSRAGEALERGRLCVVRRLVAWEPHRADLQRDLSESLHRLGCLAVDTGRSEEAEAFFEESVDVVVSVLAASPHDADAQCHLGELLKAFGKLARAYGRSDDARGAFEASVSVRRGLVAAAPLDVNLQRDLAMSLGCLGSLAGDGGRSEEARAFHQESVALLRGSLIAEPHRQDIQAELSTSLSNLGGLEAKCGRHEDAHSFLDASLMVMRGLAAAAPHRADIQRELSVACQNLGQLAVDGGRSEEALQLFQESVRVMRGLAAAEPHRADLQWDLWTLLDNLGRMNLAHGRPADARRHFEESVEGMRALVGAEPQRADFLQQLSQGLSNLAAVAFNGGSAEDAGRHLEESLRLMRQLVAAEPCRADLQTDLSSILTNLGIFARACGRLAAARGYLAESLKVLRLLVATEPQRTELQRWLALSLDCLGALAHDGGRSEEARGFFEESVRVRYSLVAVESHRADLRIELAMSYWTQYHLSGAREDEVRLLCLVLDTLRPLRNDGHENPQATRLWELASEAVEAR